MLGLASLAHAIDPFTVSDIRVEGIEQYYAGRKVPLLRVDGQPVWDSLAICEALSELFPDRGLWPADAAARRNP